MTSSSVSNQGFTVHNHRCGINFLSHLRGAPHKPTPNWDDLGWSGMTGEGVGEAVDVN
jgi:hypothetical protein